MNYQAKKFNAHSSKTSPKRVKGSPKNPYNLSPPTPKNRNNYSVENKDLISLDNSYKNKSKLNKYLNRVPNKFLTHSNNSEVQPKVDPVPRTNRSIFSGTNRLNIPEKSQINQTCQKLEDEFGINCLYKPEKPEIDEKKQEEEKVFSPEEPKLRIRKPANSKKSISWNLPQQRSEELSSKQKISKLEEKVQDLEKINKVITEKNFLMELEIEELLKNLQSLREDKENQIIRLKTDIDLLTKKLQNSFDSNAELGIILHEKELNIQKLEQNLKEKSDRHKIKCFKLKSTQKELIKSLENSKVAEEIKDFKEMIEKKNEDAKKICNLERENDLLMDEKRIGFDGNTSFQNTLKCVADENSRLRSIIIMSKLFN